MTPRYKHLEVTKTRHGKPVVYFRRGKGERIRMPPDMSSELFRTHYFAAMNGTPIGYMLAAPATKGEIQRQRTERAIRSALGGALSRSRAKGRDFALTLDWAIEQIEKQNFQCALTGIPFFAALDASSKVHPFVPSIDRINSRKGYTPDNARIVIFAMNAMLMDWGTEVFETVASAYRRTKKEQSIPAPYNPVPAPKKSSSISNTLRGSK